MAICRDAFGKLSYTLTTKNKDVLSVTRSGPGPYRIISHKPYTRGDAYIFIEKGPGVFPLWLDIPTFDSFIKAVAFLKENQNIIH